MFEALKERKGLHIFGQKRPEEWKVVGYLADVEIDSETGKVKQEYEGRFENRKGTRIEIEVNADFFIHVQTVFHNPDINDKYPIRLKVSKQNQKGGQDG